MKSAFISENIGLVHLCVKKFRDKGIEYEELYQAGCLGLMKAAEKFDPSLGFKFSTYAVPVIIGELKCLMRNNSAFKIPRKLQSLSQSAVLVKNEFEKTQGRVPSINEMSQLMNAEKEELVMALSLLEPSVSKDDENNEALLLKSDSYENELTERLALREICKSLTVEEKKLLYFRFKLCKSQKETAQYFGVSQMQISRRERKILLYIRGALDD